MQAARIADFEDIFDVGNVTRPLGESAGRKRRAAAADHRGRLGEWAFLVCRDPQRLDADVAKLVDARTARVERTRSSPVDAFDVLSAEDSWTRIISVSDEEGSGRPGETTCQWFMTARPAVWQGGPFVAPRRRQGQTR